MGRVIFEQITRGQVCTTAKPPGARLLTVASFGVAVVGMNVGAIGFTGGTKLRPVAKKSRSSSSSSACPCPWPVRLLAAGFRARRQC